jgi:hypothetical protein
MQDRKASASARVMAARTVLEMGLRATEVDDLGDRLAAVQRVIEEYAPLPNETVGMQRVIAM